MIFGITIDNIDTMPWALRAIAELPRRPVARVVVDDGRRIEDYRAPVSRLKKYADVMVQVSDSAAEPGLDPGQYEEKARRLCSLLGEYAVAFEVGNEINGSWLSPEVWEKVQRANHVCVSAGFKTACTWFLDETFVPWFGQGRKPVYFDWAFVSCYPGGLTDMRDLFSIGQVSAAIATARLFSSAKEGGIGEYGAENWIGYSGSVLPVERELVRYFDAMNGGFYWDFQRDCSKRRGGLSTLGTDIASAWNTRPGAPPEAPRAA